MTRRVQRYLRAVFSAMFEKPRNLNLPAEIGAVLTETGFDPVEFIVLIGDQRVKDRLKENTTRAVARGAFETVIAGIAHNAK